MLAAHQYEEPETLSRHRSNVPADLEIVVLRCLAKDPSSRFPYADSLDAALAACQMGRIDVEGGGQAGRTSRCA